MVGLSKLKKDDITISIFQKIISMYTLEKNIFEKDFYLPCFMDNRSRQYYGTLLSPTFNTLFRYFYKFSEEKNFKNLKESIFYSKIMENKKLVEDLNLGEEESYIALVLLIEIGKFYIKTDENYFIKTETIVKAGLDNYLKDEKKEEAIDLEDKIYIKKIKENLLKLIKKEKIDHNIVIFKDATSSGLQNFGIILGYKYEMLKYLNLEGDD